MRDHRPRTEARGLQLELEGKVSVSNREPGWNRLNQSEALSGNTLSARTKKSRGGNSSGDSEKGGREIEGRKERGRERERELDERHGSNNATCKQIQQPVFLDFNAITWQLDGRVEANSCLHTVRPTRYYDSGEIDDHGKVSMLN